MTELSRIGLLSSLPGELLLKLAGRMEREEFVSDLTDEMRDTFRLRGEYLQRRRAVAGVDLSAFLPTVAQKR